MIDPQRFHESYQALLASELTPQRRADLWEAAQQRFPELARHLLDEFNRARGSEHSSTHERLIGATFILLALANSLETRPTVEFIADDRPELPSFGFLKPLAISKTG